MTEKNKKVLIVSYYFPPTNVIGAVRISKFTKYLPEFGWEPVVLTTDTIKGIPETLPLELDKNNVIRTSYHGFHDWFIQKLVGIENGSFTGYDLQNNNKHISLREIASKCINLLIPKSIAPFIYRLLYEPMSWYRYAVRAGLELTKNNQFDIIFSTFGPTVDHIIASQLHKQTNIPWIAEFRDQWSFIQPEPFYFFDKQWEKRTLKLSNLLIAVTPTLARELESFHSKQTVLITNGFDESDYEIDVNVTPNFNITFTGNIYPGKRDPTPIFQALAQLRKKGLIYPKNIEVRFFGGNVRTYIPPIAAKWGVADFVKMGGNIEFKESIKKQMEATALLVLEWNDPKGSGILSGKIFEYFGAKKPVLATGFKGGDLDKLLQETGCGIMSNNVNEIENILLNWLEEFRVSKNISSYYHPNKDIILNYTRREQTKKLAQVFNEVLSLNSIR